MFLTNIFTADYNVKKKQYFEDLLHISDQEALFGEMISNGNNELDIEFFNIKNN
jgi:hypothetical protein